MIITQLFLAAKSTNSYNDLADFSKVHALGGTYNEQKRSIRTQTPF